MSAFYCSVEMHRKDRLGIAPHVPDFYGPGYFGSAHELADNHRKEQAIAALLEWFDLGEMAKGLTAISGVRERRWAEIREELLLKNQDRVTRWWNRRGVPR